MKRLFTFRFFVLVTLLMSLSTSVFAIFPMKIGNKSLFKSDELYIAIIGKNMSDKLIYYDLKDNSETKVSMPELTDLSNSVHKKSGDWGYADIFVKLSDIKDGIIYIDKSLACRMFVGFKSPMYLHVNKEEIKNAQGSVEKVLYGYAGADMQNATDPNIDIRWEIIEFSYDNNNVMFVNTTRVDAFQYPMGIELYGNVAEGANNAYMKRGDLLDYTSIMNRWNEQFKSSIYKNCCIDHITKDNLGGVIMQPSKVASVKNANIFDEYIDNIWTTFKTKTLHADMGQLGVWEGRVNSSDEFVMTRESDNAIAKVPYKPSTVNAIEGAGAFATGNSHDLAMQAMFCGAINRGMIDLTKADGELQYWGTQSKFYTMNTWNEYVKFFHDSEISHDTYTYAFAYDDTFEQSSTCATSHPDHLDVWIGGFAEDPGEGDTSASETIDEPTGSDEGNGNNSSEPLTGDKIVNGTTDKGLEYTCVIVQDGTNVTYTFVAQNPSNFTGLVNHLWDNTNGFREILDKNTYTFSYPIGTTVKVACKWAFAGGDTFSPYVEYLMTEKSVETGIEGLTEERVSVYPNPASEYVVVEGCKIGSSITVYDVSGNVIVNSKVTENATKVSLAELKRGMYIVKTASSRNVIMKR